MKEVILLLIIINEKLNEIIVEEQDKNILILETLKIYENLIWKQNFLEKML